MIEKSLWEFYNTVRDLKWTSKPFFRGVAEKKQISARKLEISHHLQRCASPALTSTSPNCVICNTADRECLILHASSESNMVCWLFSGVHSEEELLADLSSLDHCLWNKLPTPIDWDLVKSYLNRRNKTFYQQNWIRIHFTFCTWFYYIH